MQILALKKELAQLAAEPQRCRQEGKRVLQTIGGGEASSDMTTKRLAALDERDQLARATHGRAA